MIADEIRPYLGSARLESLIRLGDEEWQAIIRYDADLYRGTGETLEEAIALAVEGGHPVGTIYGPRYNGDAKAPKSKPARRNVLVELGMYRPLVTRR